MKLYFVRHGKTEWNLEGRFQGASGDSPLLLSSIKELELLGSFLKDIKFDRVYSSDLKRAKLTSQIITRENSYPTEISYTKTLREWNLGRLEGQKISLVSSIYPKQMKAFRHNLAQFNHSIFDAESVYRVTHRISNFVMSLKELQAQNILLVGHGATLTAAIQSLLGCEPAQLRRDGGLDNASVTILETEDFEYFDLITWNDTSYKQAALKQSI